MTVILCSLAFTLGIAIAQGLRFRGRLRREIASLWRRARRATTIHINLLPISAAIETAASLDDAAQGAFLESALHGHFDDQTDAIAAQITEITSRTFKDNAAEIREYRSGFERRLLQSWDPAIELFDVLVIFATDLGAQRNDKFRPIAAQDEDYVFEALVRLHGRACLTAFEVGALLRAGLATGALARWRTLHEITTTAFFIAENGRDTAERYLLHDTVARYRAAIIHNKYAGNNGDKPIDPETMQTLTENIEALQERFSRSFLGDYGWAANALAKTRPTFADIETATKLDHWKPFAKMASEGIHAGPHPGYWDLGMHPDTQGDFIAAGPTHFGLADPAAHSLMALGQVTTALLVHTVGMTIPDDDEAESLVSHLVTLGQVKAFIWLADLASEWFVEIQKDGESVPPRISEPPHVWREN